LGTGWHNRGHDVTFGVRNPDDPRRVSLGTARADEAAASDAEVAVLCTPWQVTQEAVQGSGDLSGKVLIDAGFGLLRGRA
jgi:8-hydroxy-5-deazaflavin:NADPH oxidoreductase